MSSALSPRLAATLGALTLAPSAHARPAGHTCYDIEYIEIAKSLDSNVTGVNDHLQVVGQYCIHEDCDPWEVGGHVYDLRTGRSETFDDEGRSAGVLRAADGTITPLPFPGEGEPTSYWALGINSAGTVVGYAWDAATGLNSSAGTRPEHLGDLVVAQAHPVAQRSGSAAPARGPGSGPRPSVAG